ncbi:hypothetical protein GH733_006459, partial [Mirounga leonina]
MQLPVPGPLALLDTTEGFARRKKTSLWFVGSLLVMSASILTIGLAATTRTENVTVGGYYPGIILGFGAFLGIIGINLVENRRQMLVAAIVFISFGVVAAFCCAVVDGVFAARHIDLRRCDRRLQPEERWAGSRRTSRSCCPEASELAKGFPDALRTASPPGPQGASGLVPGGWPPPHQQGPRGLHSRDHSSPDSVHGSSARMLRPARLACHPLAGVGDSCLSSGSTEPPLTYYEFVGVRGCQDVLHLYRLLWASAVLNVLGVLLGILTAAVLGAFKDMVPPSQLAYGPSTPPQILYNPAQQVLAYAGFCPAPATLPTCSSHPLPLQ